MVDPAALEPVDERAAQRWSFLPERRDGLGHLDGGAEVLLIRAVNHVAYSSVTFTAQAKESSSI
jgi:hypothetical protein